MWTGDSGMPYLSHVLFKGILDRLLVTFVVDQVHEALFSVKVHILLQMCAQSVDLSGTVRFQAGRPMGLITIPCRAVP